MKKNILLILLSILLIKSCYSESGMFNHQEPEVRVRIINTLDTINIRLLDKWSGYESGNVSELDYNDGGTLQITIDSGKVKVISPDINQYKLFDSLALKSHNSSGELEIENVPYGTGWWWAGEEDRIYEGLIHVYAGSNGKPEVVVQLPLENYLYGVVPYEIGGDSPAEALKSQAVAARSEAVIALTSKMYSGVHHDLTSDVECQVYSGNKKRTEASDIAVDATRGIILSEEGMPINAYYASNCGGHSELIKNVWPDRPKPESYKVAVSDAEERVFLDISTEIKAREWIESEPDVYCNPNLTTELPEWSRKNFRWKREYTIDEITKMISGEKNRGKLINIIPLERGASGRIYKTRIEFENDSMEVDGELAVRMLFQPALRSACFVVDKSEHKIILKGAGWGHGVGMCQSGAVAQAKQGKDFNSILNHYYREADLIKLY